MDSMDTNRDCPSIWVVRDTRAVLDDPGKTHTPARMSANPTFHGSPTDTFIVSLP
jgi:hypothetical protein